MSPVLVTSRGPLVFLGKELVKDDAVVVQHHLQLSHHPFLYGIALPRNSHALAIILESKVFGVHVCNKIPEPLLKALASTLPHQEVFAETGLPKEEASRIDCPMIGGASVRYECELVQTLETGDHVLCVGKVLHPAQQTSKSI